MSILKKLLIAISTYNEDTNYYYILIFITNYTMKKLLGVAALLAMLSLASCGQATEEVPADVSSDVSVETPAETPAVDVVAE